MDSSAAWQVAVRAAAALARRGSLDAGPTVPEAIDAARAAAGALRAAASTETASGSMASLPASPHPAMATPDAIAAARAAASDAAQRLSGPASHPTPAGPEDPAKRAAAAAFAESLKSSKRSRWGGDQGGSGGLSSGSAGTSINTQLSLPAANAAGKERQALVVSQLSDKLAAFRKDRGVSTSTGPGQALRLKLFMPERDEGRDRDRNWVAIFIGRDGINKRRFEQANPGTRIFVRGEGTTLRGAKPSEEEQEAMHVLLEADNQDALDKARVAVLADFNPKHHSSALTLFDEGQLAAVALDKTTDKEECAFCGKPGHHHSKCPKRRTTFTMSGVRCAACGSFGHTARDCKGDRSNVVNRFGGVAESASGAPSVFQDADFAAFEAELRRRGM
jgi:hypothetical protein